MKIITISREFGSGGRELGKRMADIMGFDYYDREIITAIAQNEGMNEAYIESTLENHAWQAVPITFHRSLTVNSHAYATSAKLLVAQKRVIEGIAKTGQDCIIVGRNADVLLTQYQPFNIFVCAEMEARINRCIERLEATEKLSRRELERKIREIDRGRSRTREILTDSKWGQREAYHLTVNTTDWNIKELAPAVADFAHRWFGRTK